MIEIVANLILFSWNNIKMHQPSFNGWYDLISHYNRWEQISKVIFKHVVRHSVVFAEQHIVIYCYLLFIIYFSFIICISYIQFEYFRSCFILFAVVVFYVLFYQWCWQLSLSFIFRFSTFCVLLFLFRILNAFSFCFVINMLLSHE